MSEQQPTSSPQWEKLIVQGMREISTEMRRARRWKNFFRAAILLYLFFLLLSFSISTHEVNVERQRSHTALIDIVGPIGSGEQANADSITASLRAAFKDKQTRGIILRINSPGGSPVQADLIYEEIQHLRAIHKKTKIYAVCSDMCTSAAYYIASATNDIYADEESLVGSIGVLIDSFGLVDAMKKVGVDRRLYTAGKNKGFLDPFTPVTPEARAHIQSMLSTIHQRFINRVIEGRGKRLHQSDPDIFSGMVWTGIGAKKLGLIDAFGSAHQVARDVIKNKRIVDYTQRSNMLDRFAKQFGASLGEAFTHGLQLAMLHTHIQ